MLNKSVFNNKATYRNSFLQSVPFNYVVIDNFFSEENADSISEEIPNWNSDSWRVFYNNSIEIKKTNNFWGDFKEYTYKAFNYLHSVEFVDLIKYITNCNELIVDEGLHGGGYHCHGNGGKLNIHLDYNIHPKLKLQRKLNIIIYMTKNWKKEYGGELQLWSGTNKKPLACEKKIDIIFNRAILFDTTQNSWHGFPNTIQCPDDISRKSLAVYYLQPPKDDNKRFRALFVPSIEQQNDKEVIDLCERRSKL